jgi:Flp pilus assembly protein TadG
MSRQRRGLFGRRRSTGQALVEFALAIPIFILLVFGLIDIGRLVYVNNAVSQGAREGARYGSVQGRSHDAADRTDLAAYTRGVLTAVPNPTVTVTCEVNGTTVTSCGTNDLLVVNVTSPVSMFTPVIGQLLGTINVSSTAKVMVNQ